MPYLSSAHEVYERNMILTGNGWPQFSADPDGNSTLHENSTTRRRRISIGDVGYSWRGRFRQIRNIIRDVFPTFPMEPQIYREYKSFRRPIIGGSVKLVDLGGKETFSSAATGLLTRGSVGWKLEFERGEGAVLNLESGGAVFRYMTVPDSNRLGNYMLQNYKSWLNEKDFHSLKPSDLILITGTYMTENWEAATFQSSSTLLSANCSVYLPDNRNSLDISWCNWTSPNHGYNTGHTHLDADSSYDSHTAPLNGSQNTTVSNIAHTEKLFDNGSRFPPSNRSFEMCCRRCVPPPQNQCIFLHGWRIRQISDLKGSYPIPLEVKEPSLIRTILESLRKPSSQLSHSVNRPKTAFEGSASLSTLVSTDDNNDTEAILEDLGSTLETGDPELDIYDIVTMILSSEQPQTLQQDSESGNVMIHDIDVIKFFETYSEELGINLQSSLESSVVHDTELLDTNPKRTPCFGLKVLSPSLRDVDALERSMQDRRLEDDEKGVDPTKFVIRSTPKPKSSGFQGLAMPSIKEDPGIVLSTESRTTMLPDDPTKDVGLSDPKANPPRKPTAKALIVSITYQGHQSKHWNERLNRWDIWDMSLGGDHEAAQAMRDLLIDNYGYQAEDITLLTDGSNWYAPPTRENIVTEMKRLVSDAQDGDRFAFFFSGHGDQMDAKNDPNEIDGRDEYIIPIDHNNHTSIILDDDIKRLLVIPIQYKKVNLISIFDCCHSGTIMDLHEFVYNKDDWFIESSQQMESPVSPAGKVLPPLDRGRQQSIPIEYASVAVRRDPSALGQNYGVTGDFEDSQDTEDKATLGSTLQQHPHHTIKRIANQLRSIRVPALPLKSSDFFTVGSTKFVHQNQPLPKDVANEQEELHYKANVTSWSACADDELNWENEKGEAMGGPMINYLSDNPHPTYDELLTKLALFMRQNGKKRRKAWKKAGRKEKVIFQRPQLGSLCALDLNERIII